MANVAFIGLGQMGAPMAANLIKQGHRLAVFDLNPQTVNSLIQQGQRAARARQKRRRAQNLSLLCCPTAIW